MKFYAQRDLRWRWKKLGTCSTTIGKDGCLLCCFAMLVEKRPDEVNEIFKKNGVYLNGCLIVWKKASDILGLEYNGYGKWDGKYPFIGKVSLNGYMHFILVLNEIVAYDPWFGIINWKEKYTIEKYGNVRTKKTMDKNQIIREYETDPKTLRFRDNVNKDIFIFRLADNQDLNAKTLDYYTINPDILVREIKQAKKTIIELKIKLKNKDDELANTKKKLTEISSQLNTCQKQVNILEKEKDSLQRQIDAQKTPQQRENRILDIIKEFLLKLWKKIKKDT